MSAQRIPETLAHHPALPLSLVAVGESVEVVEVRVTEGRRLHELGLHPGAVVQVMKNDAVAGMILAVHQDGRLAIGRGIAHKILVCLSGTKE